MYYPVKKTKVVDLLDIPDNQRNTGSEIP